MSGRRKRAPQRSWTSDELIEAIQRWAEERGKQPSATQWNVCPGPGWPNVSACVREFGSWSKAIAAAGFTPQSSGRSPAKSSGGAVADPGVSGSAKAVNDQVKEFVDGPPADAAPLPEQPHPEEPTAADVFEAERLADLVDPPRPPDLEAVRKAALHAVNSIFDLLAEVERACAH